MKYFHTIAASDNSGGAGIQIDLKTSHNFGYWGLSSITGLTVQSFEQLKEIKPVNSEFLRRQIRENYKNFRVSCTKIGAVCGRNNLEIIIDELKEIKPANIVLDPVFSPTSGNDFLNKNEIDLLRSKLLKIVDYVTPNKNELEVLSNQTLGEIDQAIEIARDLQKKYSTNFIITGGHFQKHKESLKDYIVSKNGVSSQKKERHQFSYSHGTGCVFSSALALFLVENTPITAFKKASNYTSNFFKKLNKKMY